MTPPRVVVIGAGPAGVRAAQALVEAGVRPIVIDEELLATGRSSTPIEAFSIGRFASSLQDQPITT